MNVISSVQQRLFPFYFYTDMGNKHPLTCDEENDDSACFRYPDIRKEVLFNFMDWSYYSKIKGSGYIMQYSALY